MTGLSVGIIRRKVAAVSFMLSSIALTEDIAAA
jgi:hypothetical protein